MQKSKNFIFALFSLVLVSGLMHFYQALQMHFSPLKEYDKRLTMLRQETQRDQLKLALAQDQMLDLREQVVAMGLSDKAFTKQRQIASLAPASGEPMELSSVLLAKGKADFQKGNYNQAIKVFKENIEKYPSSVLTPESQFFLAESYYLNNQFPDSLDVINEMMTQFPDNELTGYIMLRMGLIFQARNRPDEAAEVYSMLAQKYPRDQKLVAQAQSLLKNVTQK